MRSTGQPTTQTVHRLAKHTQQSHLTSMVKRCKNRQDKAWSHKAPDAQKAEDDSLQPNPSYNSTLELREQKRNNNTATRKCLRNPFAPHTEDIKVWTSQNKNPRQVNAVHLLEGQKSSTYSQPRLWLCWGSTTCTDDCTTRESQPNPCGMQRQQVG